MSFLAIYFSHVNALFTLDLPIMATSFLQMAYNMIDMIWIGIVGSGSVSAVGAAAMFVNFGIPIL